VAVEGQKLAYTVHFTSYKAVTHRRSQSRDRKWRHVTSGTRRDQEVTSFDRKSPGSCCRRPKTFIYCTYQFLKYSSAQEEAVTWQEMTSHDLRWPEMTWKWCNLTGSHLEVAVDGQKLVYTVHFTSYKAVARRRKSRDRKWRQSPHVTGSDTEVMSFDRKSPGSGCRRPKTRIHCAFPFHQGCSSQ